MATIKSYTDIYQSKILSEILPLESADLYYDIDSDKDYHIKMPTNGYFGNKRFFTEFLEKVPCWSLAALLGVFPPYLFEFERGIDFNVYPNLNGKGWHCSYMPNCIENMKKDKFRLITSGDSLVDACVEMIIRLNELKML